MNEEENYGSNIKIATDETMNTKREIQRERNRDRREKKYIWQNGFFSLMFRALFACKFHILHVISYSISCNEWSIIMMKMNLS